MEAYLQDSEGGETQLVVTTTDPEDGTLVVHLPDELGPWMSDDGRKWIRIIP